MQSIFLRWYIYPKWLLLVYTHPVLLLLWKVVPLDCSVCLFESVVAGEL